MAPETELRRPADGGPVRIHVASREPRKVYNVTRHYPIRAQRERVQGIVVLDVTVGPSGRVDDVRVVRSIPMLDEAAIEAVRQWEYEPTYAGGAPVPVAITVPVSFWLPEQERVLVEEERAPADEGVLIEERRSRRHRGRVIEGEVRRRNY